MTDRVTTGDPLRFFCFLLSRSLNKKKLSFDNLSNITTVIFSKVLWDLTVKEFT